MAANPIPKEIGVFWISHYELWAGESLEACIEASMKNSGITRAEAYDPVDACEVPRAAWDDINCPDDPDEKVEYKPREEWRDRNVMEIDWERTSHVTLRKLVQQQTSFPAYLGGRE